MPELPLWLSLTSARNSQSSHSRPIQKRWLTGPSPTIAPSTTFQLSGRSLAFQPSRVLPSNMLIQPSLPGVGAWAHTGPTITARDNAVHTNVIIRFMGDILSNGRRMHRTGLRHQPLDV